MLTTSRYKDALNDHSPTIRAHKFVGTAKGTKSGEPGLKQKDQKQVSCGSEA